MRGRHIGRAGTRGARALERARGARRSGLPLDLGISCARSRHASSTCSSAPARHAAARFSISRFRPRSRVRSGGSRSPAPAPARARVCGLGRLAARGARRERASSRGDARVSRIAAARGAEVNAVRVGTRSPPRCRCCTRFSTCRPCGPPARTTTCRAFRGPTSAPPSASASRRGTRRRRTSTCPGAKRTSALAVLPRGIRRLGGRPADAAPTRARRARTRC